MKAKKFVGMSVTALRGGRDLGAYLGAAMVVSSVMLTAYSAVAGAISNYFMKRKMKKMIAEMEKKQNGIALTGKMSATGELTV